MEKPGTNTAYQEIRKARIQENKRRLATFGIQLSASKSEKTSVRKWQRVDYSSTPLRRSSRLQGSNCYSPDQHITTTVFKGSHHHPIPQPSLRFTLGDLMPSQEEKVDEDSSVNAQEDNFNRNGQPSSSDPKGKNVLNIQQVVVSPENATDEIVKIRQQYNQHLAQSVVPVALSKSEMSPPKKSGPSIHVSMPASLVNDASASIVEDVTKTDQQSSCKYMPPSNPRDAISSSKVEESSDDGYNWRKYGQKLVKGSEIPRSYYKCTYPNCEVKKIFERSLDGHIKEIVYKGSHDHARPPQSRRFTPGALMSIQEEELDNDSSVNGQEDKSNRNGQPSSSTPNATNVLCPQQVVDGPESATDDIDKEDQFSKRRKIIDSIDITPVLKPIREPCVVVETLSEVDILDDGYRWRKYGQKIIRGNPNPRSYYKCTYVGCPVRKHVERASHDPKAAMTTYEGSHNHDVPTARKIIDSVDSTPIIKPIRDPHVVVQTLSEVGIQDGYRWRKYGQKVIRGNLNPRSYYRCTFVGCPVKKHVQRASLDPKAAITTYEGNHNHDVPTARSCKHEFSGPPPVNGVSQIRSRDDDSVCLNLEAEINRDTENRTNEQLLGTGNVQSQLSGHPSSNDPNGTNVLSPQQVVDGSKNSTDEMDKEYPVSKMRMEKPGASTYYEEIQKAQIQKNKKRLATLGLQKTISELKSLVSASRSEKTSFRRQKVDYSFSHLCHSIRLQGSNCYSPDGHITEMMYEDSHDHPRTQPSGCFTPGALMSIQDEKVDKNSSVSDQEDNFNRIGQPRSSDPNGMNFLSPQQVVDDPENATDEMDKGDPFSKRGYLRATVPISMSPCLTVPPGFSPSSFLESPVFLSNIKPEPSLTTSSFFKHHQMGQSITEAAFAFATNNSNSHISDDGYSNSFKCQFPAGASSASGLSSITPSNSTGLEQLQNKKFREEYNQHLARSVVPVTLSKSGMSTPKESGPSAHVSMHASPVNDASASEPDEITKIDQQSSCSQVPPSNPRDAISSSKAERSSDDGYNWRKYGQKLVKGSEFPRSYYKCTYLNCEVKKIFEHSPDGHITEIASKGSHDHPRPQPSRHFTPAVFMSLQEEKVDKDPSGNGQEDKFNRNGQPRSSGPNRMNVLSPRQIVDGPESATDDIDKADPFSKRRKIIDSINMPPVMKPIHEPHVVVQTLSEVDILDDGYRWRKYGQKVIRGNPNPSMSYYKCTCVGCPVRKHVERASHDPKAAIITYEGNHNHDVRTARSCNHELSGPFPVKGISWVTSRDNGSVSVNLEVGVNRDTENRTSGLLLGTRNVQSEMSGQRSSNDPYGMNVLSPQQVDGSENTTGEIDKEDPF